MLDAGTLRLLEELAISGHQKPVEVVGALVRVEYDRRFPGRREYAAEPLEVRRERARRSFGWPDVLPDDPEAERRLDQALVATETEARRFYGEDSGQSAT